MRGRIALAIVAVIAGSLIARAQFQTGGQGVGAPSGNPNTVQFNTNGVFGGISGLTSDGLGVSFGTSSQLTLYGLTVGNCLKVGANNQIADFGAGCGGTGSPQGPLGSIQFNSAGSFAGVSGASSSGSTINFTTNSLVINGQAISGVSGTTGTLASVTGTLSGNCVKGDGSGNLIDAGSACGGTSATNIAAGSNITTSGSTANVTVNVVGTPSFSTVIASGNITAGTAQFTGAVSGTTAVFQTITDGTLGGCLQGTAGVIGSTGVNCATQVTTPSIAAGSNITTSGTAANTTINAVPSGSAGAIQYTNGTNFVGDSGLLDGGGGQLTHTLGTITTPGRAIDIRATWNSTGAAFDAPLFMNITTTGFGAGSNLMDLQSSNISQFEVSPTGTIYTNSGLIATNSSVNGSVHIDTPSLVMFGDGGANANGYFNWGGESRTTTPFLTVTGGALTPTGLSVNVLSGRTYAVDADIYIGTSVNTGGFQMALTGTYASANTVYYGYVVDGGAGIAGSAGTLNANRGATLALTKTTAVASANLSGPNGYAKLTGTITVLNSGTLQVWVAQASPATTKPLTVTRGSRLLVHDMP